ncbi:VacJ family lipoprotein [Roseomonas sp. HF4]|uniref:MlaA family lipoprotein n=1 Tax=Roseomonas sp. HF4 TaxID=2562313 RepID=UPI001485771E|nr:VacJ family lipoprotein [Roseomonas sp. HF4]
MQGRIQGALGAALGLFLMLAAVPVQAAPDPLEPLNRRVHALNRVMQSWVLTPAAEAYVAVTPPGVRRGIGNALANLGEPVSALSGLAAGQLGIAANAMLRFGINTTLGLGGAQDAATGLGFPRRPFAMTDALCSWGVPSGPFLVLPVLGPSTLRDAGATIATHAALAQALGTELVAGWRAGDLFAGYVEVHADLGAIEAAALDSYALHRSAYLQRRAASCPADRAALAEQEQEDEPEAVAAAGATR